MIVNNSSKIFELIFNSAAEGIVITNHKGVIQLVNPRLCKMFGYLDDANLVGEKIEILIPDNLGTAHQHNRDEYMEAPRQRSMGSNLDLYGKKKDGFVFPVEISLNYYNSDNHQFAMALVSDISEKLNHQKKLKKLNIELEQRVKERTEELEKSQKLFKLIARNFPNGTINVFDKNLKYIYAEGQEFLKHGIESSQIIGSTYTDRLDKSLANDVKNKLKKVFGGRMISFELELKGDYYVINAVPLHSSDGAVDQILVIEKNITEKKKYDKKLEKNLEKEKNLNELKSRFVSMASHEFRTPLSTILTSTTLAEKYPKEEQTPQREKHFKRIKSSVQTLTAILNDFLSLDKLEEGKIDVNTENFDLLEVLDDVLEQMSTYLKKEQNILIEKNGETLQIQSDKNILKNILTNLLTNASKYSEDGQNIQLRIDCSTDDVEIRVTDKGIGIPKKEQKQLFERFFRAKNVTNIQGTGLGLNIVKKYVDLLHGTITFVSSEEKGTEFTVLLPLKHKNL